jgi:hypothetical protein
MLEAFNVWCSHWEPSWLFMFLLVESVGCFIFGFVGWWYYHKELHLLKLEYEYDKEFNEQYIIPKKRFKEKKKALTLPEQNLTDGEMK